MSKRGGKRSTISSESSYFRSFYWISLTVYILLTLARFNVTVNVCKFFLLKIYSNIMYVVNSQMLYRTIMC